MVKRDILSDFPVKKWQIPKGIRKSLRKSFEGIADEAVRADPIGASSKDEMVVVRNAGGKDRDRARKAVVARKEYDVALGLAR